jgi:hypothetical protein
VEGLRGGVLRAGDAVDIPAAVGPYQGEEGPVEGAPDPQSALRRVDTDDVHIGDVRFGLREEADEERGEFSVGALDEETGGGEVLEVQARKQQRAFDCPSLALEPAPPPVQHGQYPQVILGPGVPGGKSRRKVVDHPRSVEALGRDRAKIEQLDAVQNHFTRCPSRTPTA